MGSRSPGRRRGRRYDPSWPIRALLLLFPLWWALGLGAFAFPLFAVPMAVILWRRRGRLVLPPGFGWWGLFLLLNVISMVMLPFAVPETLAGSTTGRAIAVLTNLAMYLSATVTLLYVGNLSERELPQARLVRMLGILFLVLVAGGLLGVLVPRFGFTSPLEMALPSGMRHNLYVQALVHPTAAQIQAGLGDAARPSAPFGYTNFWGNNFSILLVWFVVWGWRSRSLLRHAATVAVLIVAVIPVVQSLNRGLWTGLGLSVVYVAAQLARRARFGAVLGLVTVGLVALLALALTPLHDTVNQRLANPRSNDLRSFLTQASIDGAMRSPVIGWGGTRKTLGSVQSISVGASANCPQCGNFAIGSNGQLWYVLFCQGFLGAALFIGFFLSTGLRYMRRRGKVFTAAGLILLLAIFYSTVYSFLPAALTLTFISLAVAWRQETSGVPGNRGAATADQ
jgi:hypothetical protein